MLIELRINDFLVIDQLAVEFGSGLTALTGETGAGKSILAGALSLLLGERAFADVVRTGADKARVEGVFDISAEPKISAILDEHGLPLEDDLLILRREVVREGRNRAWVNGSAATAGMMVQLGAVLVDLHGQHAHQRLLDRQEQREILDAFAGAGEVSREVARLHATVVALEAERDARVARAREIESRADFIRFQTQEIREANPQGDEEEALAAETTRLTHAEDLAAQANRLHEGLYGGEDAVSDRLSEAVRTLQRLAALDARLVPIKEALEGAFHTASDAGQELGSYAGTVEHDPARLEQVRARLDLLGKLKRKYGASLAEVLQTQSELEAELAELDQSTVELEGLQRRIDEGRVEFSKSAARLTQMREGAAIGLSQAVQDLLPGLGLEGATFQIRLERFSEPRATGAEGVQFRASLNPGFDPRPLARIASGGELSRVMLALNSVLADVDPVPTLVFDEVDAGVGGVVAARVAEQLRSVAERRQVFVITHLAQVASVANQHFRVQKDGAGAVASSELQIMEGESRVEEIARMLGGDPESATSRAHAKELLAG